MYNSAIFSTLSAQTYFLFTVDIDFLTGFSFDLENANRYSFTKVEQFNNINKNALVESLNYIYHNISSLTKLDNAACIRAYGNDYVTSYSDLLLTSSTKNSTNSLLSWDSNISFIIDFISHAPYAYNWVCNGNREI